MEVEEFPQLEQLRRDFQSKDLAVLAFHPTPDPQGKVRAYLKRQKFQFTTLVGKAQNGGSPFGMVVIGSTVLIGADGKVAWRSVKPDVAEIRKAVEALPGPK